MFDVLLFIAAGLSYYSLTSFLQQIWPESDDEHIEIDDNNEAMIVEN